jgi:hypothetical protein
MSDTSRHSHRDDRHHRRHHDSHHSQERTKSDDRSVNGSIPYTQCSQLNTLRAVGQNTTS